jgi:transposase-like protein
MEEKKKRLRRTFTPEFKAEAVRLAEEGSKSMWAIARDLGIPGKSLQQWVKQARVDAGKGSAGALTSDEKAELTALRRENRVLKEEREILKKAAAFFAKENR